uniref:Uncharacterized protein n=1 Tax=Candidatus Kentrum sp. LFY TaxID=2126342 RepID=A0A450W7X5_9GAMM|nr:MAG: hypothetical protein BECKLFY1418C_GA0070996_100280 [Candidatus Kentron sp. LFY]
MCNGPQLSDRFRGSIFQFRIILRFRSLYSMALFDTNQLPKAIGGERFCAFWPDYWQELKFELKIFLCSKDQKYAELRKKLSNRADRSEKTIVAIIAAEVAMELGVAAGALVPFVAMCLVVAVRIGWEAFCNSQNWDMPLKKWEQSG